MHQLPGPLEIEYDGDRKGEPPRLDTLLDIFHSCSKEFSPIYIFFDGLDECTDEQREDMLELIIKFCKSESVIRVFLTSQPQFTHVVDELSKTLKTAAYDKLEITANKGDLEQYVILKLKRSGQLQLKEYVLKDIMDGNEGM